MTESEKLADEIEARGTNMSIVFSQTDVKLIVSALRASSAQGVGREIWRPVSEADFCEDRGGYSRTKILLLKNKQGDIKISSLMKRHSDGVIGLFSDDFGPTHFADLAQVAALSHPSAATGNEWQPIESAPHTDYGYILACAAGSKIPMIAGWDEDEKRWYAFNGAFKKTWTPTHWQPLHSPPRLTGKYPGDSEAKADAIDNLKRGRPDV